MVTEGTVSLGGFEWGGGWGFGTSTVVRGGGSSTVGVDALLTCGLDWRRPETAGNDT